MTKIQTASLEFQQNGTPVSTEFDDIYFSKDNGLEESLYVFQQGNDLLNRWQNWQQSHFTIAETGFGTGLNFLAVCQTFSQFKQNNPNHPLKQLNFISFEKYPLSKTDLAQALAPWQMLSCWSEQLVNAYPYLVKGAHRLEFDNQIKLDLWLGDILEQLPEVPDNHNGVVDAWFLDGFAPSKNQAMWHPTVFEQMARLASPNGTLATFTAAGFVRRGLIEAGFTVNKRKGFGYKREMLTGIFQPDSAKPKTTVHAAQFPVSSSSSKQTCIVGGGIAAICSALTLALRGHQVRLICQGELADGASGNRQGAIYPLIQNNHNSITDCHLKSYQYACQFYQKWRNTFEFSADFCGVVQLAFSDKMQARQQALLDNPVWPREIFEWVTQPDIAELTGIQFNFAGLHFPDAGWLNPMSFILAAIKYLTAQNSLTVSVNTQLTEFNRINNSWHLSCQQNGKTVEFKTDNLVLCQGWQLNQTTQTQHLKLEPSRGQVSYLTATEQVTSLKKVICHKGYLTPSWQNLLCVGATFEQDNTNCNHLYQDDIKNLQLHQKHTPELTDWLIPDNLDSSRASIRATTKDRLPMIGCFSPVNSFTADFAHFAKGGRAPKQAAQVYPNLYVLAGLGSRGLTNAPLMAECLAAIINDEILPLSIKTFEALHANRFIIREMKRNEYSN
ncbi:bifunctional tRNA (5-methylaminomethyl-2-thiouridine)(34)-methyltransferase MnmD/FAD-dependent 5-carboxymethylaminomethyl-2-thiouridine(34) oxidoreductase MnmC [Catenovulum sp. 2E275]|uniref:bifunctional tRNA (5-methylaminomethyl-2-thiouridine)(34)-methyltransferase MnmD/FAD-dependent 5-carboxymethylaminomethyl-2-thiouridine(34) oxidoreductase MnmC n=1 Tax=Catenovulum sp. 2E275 TaxID=2980497 RepID=UPI0021D379DC|nr:bifunctional tRNA (5-methylaminomethyl-2-thiouridine)(34)-methyltransferase MnmD/FAD-dependent 5-carboxymethylaminomethyl-2-thiouridine(34) oxidoreductase MnmC [Catenovulum sp. 2E275]MCU4674673.1 bifunctional tRNA (5-methylaminomethyl-2-thiouridine)(34)-methyltransferase MnmD/FAD-dependent 5-carboxymethylaminomethyl-2-thiouridine(34) oxidoreductase MnmC [Catenovulum sp. 2E275]